MNRTIGIVLMASLLLGCTIRYSFNGGSAPPWAETVQVDYFAPSEKATLASGLASQLFTEALRDVFLSQTKLSITPDKGNLVFKGAIQEYSIRPINIQASSETAAQNRLQMGVEVRYYWNKPYEDGKPGFEFTDSLISQRTYTRFADYDSNSDFSSIEESLLTEINDQITQDIFNASLGDW